tara:strand:+ start:4622 stop:5212 length:591 start_codon:yes stop_codon:yes gene_type:complete
MQFQIHEYNYLKNFDDRIYESKIDSRHRIELLDKLNEIEDLNLYNHELAGDLEEEYELTHEKIGTLLYSNIENSIFQHLKNIVQNISQFELSSLWVNYQKKNEYNPAHLHSGTFSFVWYLDIPEEIRQEHKQQKSYKHTKTRGLIQFSANHSNDFIVLNPKTDDLLLFRAHHIHQVYPFYSDNTRISVSGNIIIKT